MSKIWQLDWQTWLGSCHPQLSPRTTFSDWATRVFCPPSQQMKISGIPESPGDRCFNEAKIPEHSQPMGTSWSYQRCCKKWQFEYIWVLLLWDFKALNKWCLYDFNANLMGKQRNVQLYIVIWNLKDKCVREMAQMCFFQSYIYIVFVDFCIWGMS